jgi:hypothetical protein
LGKGVHFTLVIIKYQIELGNVRFTLGAFPVFYDEVMAAYQLLTIKTVQIVLCHSSPHVQKLWLLGVQQGYSSN